MANTRSNISLDVSGKFKEEGRLVFNIYLIILVMMEK
jgi:hypothetical protein